MEKPKQLWVCVPDRLKQEKPEMWVYLSVIQILNIDTEVCGISWPESTSCAPTAWKNEEHIEKLRRKVCECWESWRGKTCSRGKRAQKDKIVITPSFSHQQCFSESLLSHGIASYCFKAGISQVAGVPRHGERRDALAQEKGIVVFCQNTVSFGSKLWQRWKKNVCFTISQHFQQML